MSTLVRISNNSLVTRLIDHLRAPLYRNGYALVLSSIGTSGLGVIYWILAAHYYTTEAVGLNSAVLSAVMLLANLAQLNLVNALNRFIPGAGRAAGRLIGSAYLISLMVALAASVVYVAGVNLWSPALAFLKRDLSLGLWFIVVTLAWCIFALQDSALTGLRQATWVPVENLLFAVTKIGLVVLLAASLPLYGILASWTIPLVLTIPPINFLIFRYLLPRHVRTTGRQAAPIRPPEIVQYVAGDYLSSLVWVATVNMMPLLVINQLGATANAYFYLSWTMAYTLYLVSRNMGMSLVAEAAADPTNLHFYAYRTFIQSCRLLLPVIGAMIVGAPLILRLFGSDYASASANLLRLLCLSALPNTVVAIYTSVARVQRRMRSIVMVYTALCGLVLGLSFVLMPTLGIEGLGWAWLIGETIMAGILLLTELRTMWLLRLMDTVKLTVVLRLPRQLLQRWNDRRQKLSAVRLFPQIAATLTTPSVANWAVQDLVQPVNEAVVVNLGPIGQPPAAVLKLPRSNCAVTSLQTQKEVLTELFANPQLKEFSALLPAVLTDGEITGQPYTIERRLPGVDARELLLSNPAACVRVSNVAAAAIAQLHRGTATTVVADKVVLQQWIDDPIATIRCVLARRTRPRDNLSALDRLAAELKTRLGDQTLTASWIHGDFMPGNILMSSDGAVLTGIVDWDLAAFGELPQVDVVHFLLSTRVLMEHRELGDVMRRLLEQDSWTENERAILAASCAALGHTVVDLRTLMLLSWLRHIAANLKKSTRYKRNWLWLIKNVEGVLHYV